MMLFPKALFLARKFPKIDTNSIFLLNFHQKFSNSSQIFPNQFPNFCPNARKCNAEFSNIFKIGLNSAFCNFLKEFFANVRKFSGVWGGGSAPGPPTRPAITLKPPENFSCLRHCIIGYNNRNL